MELALRYIGDSINELTSTNGESTITEDVVEWNGKVSEELIESLRSIANELEEHNNK